MSKYVLRQWTGEPLVEISDDAVFEWWRERVRVAELFQHGEGVQRSKAIVPGLVVDYAVCGNEITILCVTDLRALRRGGTVVMYKNIDHNTEMTDG